MSAVDGSGPPGRSSWDSPNKAGWTVNFRYRQRRDADIFAHFCPAHIFRITPGEGNSASLDGQGRAGGSGPGRRPRLASWPDCQPISRHWLWDVHQETPNMAG